jgi:hypothetical protein
VSTAAIPRARKVPDAHSEPPRHSRRLQKLRAFSTWQPSTEAGQVHLQRSSRSRRSSPVGQGRIRGSARAHRPARRPNPHATPRTTPRPREARSRPPADLPPARHPWQFRCRRAEPLPVRVQRPENRAEIAIRRGPPSLHPRRRRSASASAIFCARSARSCNGSRVARRWRVRI